MTDTDALDAGLAAKRRTKSRGCRWCREGYLVENGEHLIVKSILPARVSIKVCTDALKEKDRAHD